MSCPARPGSSPPSFSATLPCFSPGPRPSGGRRPSPTRPPGKHARRWARPTRGAGQGGERPDSTPAGRVPRSALVPVTLLWSAQTARYSGHSFKAVTAGRSPGSGPFSARTRLCRGHSPCPSHHPLLPAFSAGPPSSALTGQKALRRLSPVVSLLRSVPSVSLSPQECDAEFLHARPVLVLGRQPGGLALCALLLEHAPTPRRSPVL